eukprot:scaffold45045_cov27-Prasinocladus_malaysianus.AAC.1
MANGRFAALKYNARLCGSHVSMLTMRSIGRRIIRLEGRPRLGAAGLAVGDGLSGADSSEEGQVQLDSRLSARLWARGEAACRCAYCEPELAVYIRHKPEIWGTY